MSPFLPALLLASAPSVSVQPLQDGWFRLTIIYKPSGIEAHSNAQLRLIAAAARLCKGRQGAVSEGTLNVDEVPESSSAARKLALSGKWRCGPVPSSP